MNITSRFLLMAATTAAVILPAYAASLSFRVTPINMGNFSADFAVTTKTTGKGTEYEITINRKNLDPVRFTRPAPAQLAKVNQTETSFGIEGFRVIKASQISRDQVRYRFMANPEEVSNLCFEVGFPDYVIANGKRQWTPASEYYYLHLKDFVPKK